MHMLDNAGIYWGTYMARPTYVKESAGSRRAKAVPVLAIAFPRFFVHDPDESRLSAPAEKMTYESLFAATRAPPLSLTNLAAWIEGRSYERHIHGKPTDRRVCRTAFRDMATLMIEAERHAAPEINQRWWRSGPALIYNLGGLHEPRYRLSFLCPGPGIPRHSPYMCG